MPELPDLNDAEFSLEPSEVKEANPADLQSGRASKPPATKPPPKGRVGGEPQVISYRHPDKRKNNPHVGLVNEDTDPGQPKTAWRYDPHIDPALAFDPGRGRIENLIDHALASGDENVMRAALEELKRMQSPYLNWTGKAERTSFEVDTVSLHVHERIDAMSILAAVRKRMHDAKAGKASPTIQPDIFNAPFENVPLRDAIDFYKHERGWANRLIAGDSLLVMNSLLQKESMAGQVQMIYIDPPYGIKYGSNFQPFTDKRDVKDRKDEDLTQEPEMIKAFRDTWELGIHSYLTYLRDRLLLAKELLSESGSVFVQISDENLHHVREVLDEVLGSGNFVSNITVAKTTSATSEVLPGICDYVVWYAKAKDKFKYYQLFFDKVAGLQGATGYTKVLLPNGEIRRLSEGERKDPLLIPTGAKIIATGDLTSQRPPGNFPINFRGITFLPVKGYWKTGIEGFPRVIRAGRVEATSGDRLSYIRHLEDFPAYPVNNLWADTVGQNQFAGDKLYVVQTGNRIIERCLLMTTDPGDLVLDPTCGSGTTAFVAEKWGRRWITCDTSRVAVTLTKQRLMTSNYDYYELRYPHEGVRGGFIYKTVPHVTLKSIANNPEIDEIYERTHPSIEAALTDLNKVAGKQLREWEVPFGFPDDWPEQARDAFNAFHSARQAMQKRMDASIAAHAEFETLYDQPVIAKNKLRVTGPFTVEAVPFPSVSPLDEAAVPPDVNSADVAIARSGESARQHRWRDELLKTGIRGKGGQTLKFTDLETIPATECLHVMGTVMDSGERVVVSFGPEHAALEQRQVERALREAETLFPRPKMIVFCAFTFDPEAAKDIDALRGIVALKAQMNTDLLTQDLKKARSSNQSFWLMGQPDVELRKQKNGRYVVEVNGFDYFDTSKGELVSGGKSKIAMWSLDPDYDNRSLFPRQVFFPLAGKEGGWKKLKKSIRAELNEELLDCFHGTVSLPFEAGENRTVAVKIVDDRGIESLKVIALAGEK